jgi:hypothetical protein
VLIAFLLGSCMGGMTASPDVEFVEIRQPAETVTVEPEPLPAEVVHPQSCKDAMRYAERMADEAEQMFALGDRQLDIVSQARLQLADSASLAKVEEAQRDLRSDLIGNLSKLSEATYSYEQAAAECKKEVE